MHNIIKKLTDFLNSKLFYLIFRLWFDPYLIRKDMFIILILSYLDFLNFRYHYKLIQIHFFLRMEDYFIYLNKYVIIIL